MKELKIIVRKADPAENDTTIKIPLPSLKFVNSLIPEWVNHKLVEKGISIQELVNDISTEETSRKIAELQHNDETIIISIETVTNGKPQK